MRLARPGGATSPARLTLEASHKNRAFPDQVEGGVRPILFALVRAWYACSSDLPDLSRTCVAGDDAVPFQYTQCSDGFSAKQAPVLSSGPIVPRGFRACGQFRRLSLCLRSRWKVGRGLEQGRGGG